MKKILLLLLLLPSLLSGQMISNRLLNYPVGTSLPPVGYSYSSCTVEIHSVIEAASGTHNSINGLTINPPGLTNAGGTTNKTAALRIEGANTQGIATADYAMFVKQGNSVHGGSLKIKDTSTATAYLHIAAGTATASTAPLKLTSGTNLSTTEAGAVEYDGTHLYFTAANAGSRYTLDRQVIGASYSGTGTATTTYTVTIGTTQANATYKVTVEPTNVLTAVLQYVTNKTTTTFDVTFVSALTGTVAFDWTLVP